MYNFRIQLLSDDGPLINRPFGVVLHAPNGDEMVKLEALQMAAKIINDEIVAHAKPHE